MITVPLGVDAEGVEGLLAAHPHLGMPQAELTHRLETLQRPAALQRFKQIPQFRIKGWRLQQFIPFKPICCYPTAVKYAPQTAHTGGLLEFGREQRGDIILRHIKKQIFFIAYGVPHGVSGHGHPAASEAWNGQ